MKSDYNYFEPIVILGLSQNLDYEYALVDKTDCLSAQKGGGDTNLSPSKLDCSVCPIFNGQTSDYDLHYWSDCGSVNCNPLGGGVLNICLLGLLIVGLGVTSEAERYSCCWVFLSLLLWNLNFLVLTQH